MKNAHRLRNLLQITSKEDMPDLDTAFDHTILQIIPVVVPLALIEGYDEDNEELAGGDMICFKDLSALVYFESKILVLDMDKEEDTIMLRIIAKLSKKYLHEEKQQNRKPH